MPSRGQPLIVVNINWDFIVQTGKSWNNRAVVVLLC
jgi:hypothetical protein